MSWVSVVIYSDTKDIPLSIRYRAARIICNGEVLKDTHPFEPILTCRLFRKDGKLSIINEGPVVREAIPTYLNLFKHLDDIKRLGTLEPLWKPECKNQRPTDLLLPS